jgi:hypothetical protein
MPSGGSASVRWNQLSKASSASASALILGGDFEEWINPCLNGPFLQKVAAKGVYRADASEFQLLKRMDQPVALLRRRQGSRLFNLAPQAKLRLTGRFLSEGDRHDPVERTAAGAD